MSCKSTHEAKGLLRMVTHAGHPVAEIRALIAVSDTDKESLRKWIDGQPNNTARKAAERVVENAFRFRMVTSRKFEALLKSRRIAG